MTPLPGVTRRRLLLAALAWPTPPHARALPGDAERAARSGIWLARRDDGHSFAFVIRDRVGYTIDDEDEATWSVDVNGPVQNVQVFPAKGRSYAYQTVTSRFDGQQWHYSDLVDGRTRQVVAQRIQVPLREIPSIRQRAGIHAYHLGFDRWKLYDAQGRGVQRAEDTAYIRMAKTARSRTPVVRPDPGQGDDGAMHLEGSVFQRVETHHLTGEPAFQGHYHFWHDAKGRNSPGDALDWQLAAEGPCHWFHRNGRLQQFGRYQEGRLHGALRIHDGAGRLIRTEQGRPLSDYRWLIEDRVLGRRD